MPAGDRRVQGFAWQVHDNAIDNWRDPSPPDAMVRAWLGLDPRALSVEAFTYWAGLIQGEALREYVDNFRRRMFDSAAAVFWMFNDCWPATRSWTVVDARLRRTPSFHPVRRAMATVSVACVHEDGRVHVFGVNDGDAAVAGELRFGAFALAGAYLVDRRVGVELPADASARLASFPLPPSFDPAGAAAFATLADRGGGGATLARNRLLLPRWADVRWPPADVRVSVRSGRATFACDAFAFGVCIDLDGDRPLADNFFDLFPGQPHTIDWPYADPPRVLHVGNALARH